MDIKSGGFPKKSFVETVKETFADVKAKRVETKAKRKSKRVGVVFSTLTFATQLLIFTVVSYTSAIVVSEMFITVVLKKVLAAGIQAGLVSENNMVSLIGGWVAPSLFMVLAAFGVWFMAIKGFWNFLNRVFGAWRKANIERILASDKKTKG